MRIGRLCHADNSAEILKWRVEGDTLDESDDEDVDGMVMDAGDLDQEAQLLERYFILKPASLCDGQGIAAAFGITAALSKFSSR